MLHKLSRRSFFGAAAAAPIALPMAAKAIAASPILEEVNAVGIPVSKITAFELFDAGDTRYSGYEILRVATQAIPTIENPYYGDWDEDAP